ncbi:NAD(P)H-dependent glycerol-3-phosphate dehydrogenase [Schlesneria paludicola]|uniref:NAD(P)H-dependent glycerol-3-phosphate dehydrogenase n=1 Tax=Schlesneria paludicola TaxID=360056 RepID=UPI00029B2A38|nr:NAD(P)H-dependent glycerol-3-phosphate dehydrogenase [Schlesneria paludicola]
MATNIAILGSGAMATACATLLAEHDNQTVSIWARDPQIAQQIQQTRENKRLLPGVLLSDRISITSDVELALRDAEYIVAAIPTQFLRSSLQDIKVHLTRNRPVISVIKGIENATFMRPSEIISEVLGSRAVVAVGGPSHAEEISRRMPATVVAASGDLGLARQVQRMFNTDRFRVYTNLDLIGVELAAALKNVIAIAAGISDGLGFGDNAKSSLMTRGLVEMTRFGQRFGAEATTFTGLAGMGDLITTCVSPYGRNRGVGVRLGKGESLDQIIQSMDAVAEGVATTKSVFDVAEQEGIEMPITTEVYRVLYEHRAADEATRALMLRPLRAE